MKHSLALLILALSVFYPVLLQGDARVFPLGVTIYARSNAGMALRFSHRMKASWWI